MQVASKHDEDISRLFASLLHAYSFHFWVSEFSKKSMNKISKNEELNDYKLNKS